MSVGQVSFEGVWKSFRTGESVTTLRDAIPSLARRLIGKTSSQGERNIFWALQDISFSASPGKVLGIIGANGAGKTTILALISNILRANRGNVRVSGRVAALLHLGALSHLDFTGRENIYLNGIIMGMKKNEIDRKFDSIVSFSGIDESFIDTPLKRYSTGMCTRLGFAVAAHVDPDILLIDELLSVGDMGFQQKSFQKIYDLARSGRTVIFVSHYLGAVETFADRVLWMDKGKIRAEGPPQNVLNAYLDSYDTGRLTEAQKSRRLATEDGSFEITKVVFKDSGAAEKNVFHYGDSLTVELRYKAAHRIKKPHFVLGVTDGRGWNIFMASMLADGMAPEFIEGEGAVKCMFNHLPLLPKVYEIWGSVRGEEGLGELIDWQMFGAFRIGEEKRPTALEPVGKASITHLRAEAPCFVPYQWVIQ